MSDSPSSSLFFVDSQGHRHYGLAVAPGRYRGATEVDGRDAYLVIFMCPNCDSVFILYYISSDREYIGHKLLHPGEYSVDYVLLEAWREFDIKPHYWILAEETNLQSIISKELGKECIETYNRLREVVSRFRWAENVREQIYGTSGVYGSQGVEQYESNRLFYPTVPTESLSPLTL